MTTTIATTTATTSSATNALNKFVSGLKSPETQKHYPRLLKLFFDFVFPPSNGSDDVNNDNCLSLEEKADIFVNKTRENPQWAQDSITSFIELCKQRVNVDKTLTAGTLHNYYHIIKTFCELTDIETVANWKKIARGLPKARSLANDRSPLIEEIRELVKHSDRRLKAIVYTMCSSGVRVGAFEYLKWKHVIPKFDEKTGQVIIAAKLIVYAGEPEQHYAFITPECYGVLQDYMKFREDYGENVTGESWLIRDLWQTSDVARNSNNNSSSSSSNSSHRRGAGKGLASNPKRLSVGAIKKELLRAEEKQGLHPNLPNGVRRHEWKTAHGFRKFFQSTAIVAGMKPMNVEYLMGHSMGITSHYFRPQEQEVLRDYLKAVDNLSVNRDQKIATQLQKQVTELTEKSEQENYAILGKLIEKEKKFEEMKRNQEEMEKKLNFMYQALRASNVLNEFHEEQKQLLAESDKMREVTREVLREEQEELEEGLNEMNDV